MNQNYVGRYTKSAERESNISIVMNSITKEWDKGSGSAPPCRGSIQDLERQQSTMPSRSLTQRYTSDRSVRTIKGPHCLAWPRNLTPLRPAHSSCRRRRSQWLLMISLHHSQHNDPLWRLVMDFIWENLVLSPPSLAGIFTRGSLFGGVCGFQSSIWQIGFREFLCSSSTKVFLSWMEDWFRISS